MPVITSIEDLKRMHRSRTPKMFYDYAESGSYTEQTFRENTTDFARLKLRQKVAVDMSNRSTASDIVGLPAAMPVAQSAAHDGLIMVDTALGCLWSLARILEGQLPPGPTQLTARCS